MTLSRCQTFGVELHTVLSLTLVVSKDLGEDRTVNPATFRSTLAHTGTDEVVHQRGGHEASRAMETKPHFYGKASCKFAPWEFVCVGFCPCPLVVSCFKLRKLLWDKGCFQMKEFS